jgi:hypothetical protein
VVPNFPVNAGREGYVYAWIGDASGSVSSSGLFGWFTIYNYTTRQFTEVSRPIQPFQGFRAEWIVERQAGYQLPNFHSLVLSGAYAADRTYHEADFATDGSVVWWLENDKGQLMSTASIESSGNAVDLFWLAGQ